MWWRQIITGPDNATVSIGRVLGLIVFAVFILGIPVFAVVTLANGKIAADAWASMLDKLQVYIPAIILSIGGLIGLAGATDPKGGGQ